MTGIVWLLRSEARAKASEGAERIERDGRASKHHMPAQSAAVVRRTEEVSSMFLRRSAILLVAAVAAALWPVTAAQAHDILKSSDPAKDAKVSDLSEVVPGVQQAVKFPKVVVLNAAEEQFQSGEAGFRGKKVVQTFSGMLPPGKYTIGYRVVSSDGHPRTGEIPFTVIPSAHAHPDSQCGRLPESRIHRRRVHSAERPARGADPDSSGERDQRVGERWSLGAPVVVVGLAAVMAGSASSSAGVAVRAVDQTSDQRDPVGPEALQDEADDREHPDHEHARVIPGRRGGDPVGAAGNRMRPVAGWRA